jgi:glutathione S-transferase
MKLYSFDLSPYAARARISIYAKKLPIEIVAPPAGGIKSAEYLALNPMGRVPVLVLDDGVSIPESETIVEYLEDAFPEPALRPHGAEGMAKVRLISRVAEIYVQAPLFALFAQLDPKGGRDEAAVTAGIAKLSEGMTALERLMPQGDYAAGDKFTTADCQVTPVCFFLNVVLSGLDRLDVMSDHPRLSAYITSSKKDPVLAKVLGEMAEGLKAFRRAQG